MIATPLARRVLALHLPLISSERVTRQRAAPPDTPFVLVGRVGGAVRIAALDAAALAEGLVPGMALADARARLPELVSLPHDPDADAALLDWLADGADRYTPIVAVRPPHGLLLDITGCTHPFGGENGLVDDLHRRLLRLGLTAQLAVADNADAALALAEHQLADIGDLPVTALGGPESDHLALRRAGLRNVADVARQHRPALAARFGADLVAALARLLGEANHPISPRRLPAPVEVETRFASPLTHSESALLAIEALAVRAGLRLAERAEGGRRFDEE